MEENKSVYALKKVNKPESFCAEIKSIKGVTDAKVDMEKMTIEYTIDEWTSDYDVFTQIMTIAEGYGCEFDFDRDDQAEDEAEVEDVALEEKKPEESDEEFIDEDDEPESDEEDKNKKKRKVLPERTQRIIELSVALVFFGVSLFFKDTVQLIFLAVAFAVAGYDVLYEAIVKIGAKQFINEELLLSLAFFAAIFLGKPVDGVAAVLMYTLSAFAVKTGLEIISEKSPVYEMPEKCRKALSVDKAKKTNVEEICEGDVVYFMKGEYCLFDGTVKNAVNLTDVNGESRYVQENGKVLAGERFEENAFVIVSKVAGAGKFDKRNERAKKVVGSNSKLQSLVAEKSKIYLPILLVICLALAFLPPLAFPVYSDGLMRWGYTAAMFAALGSSMLACGANAIAIFASLIPAKKAGVMPAEYSEAEKLSNAGEVYFDRESVMLEGEEIKPDSRGASLELASLSKKTVLVTSADEEKAVKTCKECCIGEYSANKTDGTKTEVFDKALKSGNVVVLSEKTAKKYGLTQENGVIIAYSDEESDYSANVTITDSAMACVPFAVKLAARTVKTCKATAITCGVVKAILAVLALCGIGGLWWVMLADTLVGVCACVCSLINCKDFN